MKNSELMVLAEWLATLGISIIKINYEKNTIEIAPAPTEGVDEEFIANMWAVMDAAGNLLIC